MPKIKKEGQDDIIEEILLTFQQKQELAKEILEKGVENFLLEKKVIKVDENKQWTIMQYEGLKNAGIEAVYNYKYTTDIPYTFWKEVISQVQVYISYKHEKDREQNFSLQMVAEEVIQRPRYVN